MANKQSGEREVTRLLDERRKWLISGNYRDWPLNKLPFHVIWNELSRSGLKLREGQYE